MANATSAFFERLAERGTAPELERTTGTLRVDVERDGQVDHWRVEMRRGAVTVSRWLIQHDCSSGVSARSRPCEATVRCERPNSPTSAPSTRPPSSNTIACIP